MTKPTVKPAAKPAQQTTTTKFGACPACDGMGRLQNVRRARTPRGTMRAKTCHICNGSGQVITSRTDTVR